MAATDLDGNRCDETRFPFTGPNDADPATPALVNPCQGTFRVLPEMANMQQRLRVAADMLHSHLLMAGGGMYSGSGEGALVQFFAPVRPYRIGKIDAYSAGGVFFRDDAISLVYVPNTTAQSTIANILATPAAQVRVSAQPGCPDQDPLCGFGVGQTVLVLDDTGASDTFQITGVRRQSLELEAHAQTLSKTYGIGAFITQVEMHTCHLDSTADQLMHYDGSPAGLRCRGPALPVLRRPQSADVATIGTENCLFNRAGRLKLRTLRAGNGSLVELTNPQLRNGPWRRLRIWESSRLPSSLRRSPRWCSQRRCWRSHPWPTSRVRKRRAGRRSPRMIGPRSTPTMTCMAGRV